MVNVDHQRHRRNTAATATTPAGMTRRRQEEKIKVIRRTLKEEKELEREHEERPIICVGRG
jgi:hypothetical protein